MTEELRKALERIEALGDVTESHGCALIARAALASKPLPPTDDVRALISELQNPWQNNPAPRSDRPWREPGGDEERGPLPNWAHSLLSRAAAALSAQSPLTEGEQRAVDHALRLQVEESAQSPSPPSFGQRCPKCGAWLDIGSDGSASCNLCRLGFRKEELATPSSGEVEAVARAALEIIANAANPMNAPTYAMRGTINELKRLAREALSPKADGG